MSGDVRIHKRSSYQDGTIVPNVTAQNASLSWGARGLLAYFLSLPPGWMIRESEVIKQSPNGRDHLRSLVRELEAHCYVKRHQTRRPDGSVGPADWEVWDLPHTEPVTAPPAARKPRQKRRKSAPLTENPSTAETPQTGSPSTENPSTVTTQSQPAESPWPENPSTVSTVDGLTVDGKSDSIERSIKSRKNNRELSVKTTQALGPKDPAEAAARSAGGPQLPPCAEPHRALVVAWWRSRLRKHPKAPNALSEADVAAMVYADAQGVLPAFLADAEARSLKSLGHQYRATVSRLQAGPGIAQSFSEFQAVYMAITEKAHGQSVTLARDEFIAATRHGLDPAQVTAALRRAVAAHDAATRSGRFAPQFPDMARWLRDGRHLAYAQHSAADGSIPASLPPRPTEESHPDPQERGEAYRRWLCAVQGLSPDHHHQSTQPAR